MAAHDDARVKKRKRKASRPSRLPETAAKIGFIEMEGL